MRTSPSFISYLQNLNFLTYFLLKILETYLFWLVKFLILCFFLWLPGANLSVLFLLFPIIGTHSVYKIFWFLCILLLKCKSKWTPPTSSLNFLYGLANLKAPKFFFLISFWYNLISKLLSPHVSFTKNLIFLLFLIFFKIFLLNFRYYFWSANFLWIFLL